MDLGARMLQTVRGDLLPLEKPLLDSRLASCHLRNFIAFLCFLCIYVDFINFHIFSNISVDFHGFQSMDAEKW